MDIEIRRNDDLERTDIVQAQFTTVLITYLLPLNTYSFTIFVVSDIGRSRLSMINGSTLSLSKLLEKLLLFFHFITFVGLSSPTTLNITTVSTTQFLLSWQVSYSVIMKATISALFYQAASAINVRHYYSSNEMDNRSLYTGWKFSSKCYN